MLFTFLGAGTVLRATGNTKYTFRANLYAAIIYVPMAFLLIKLYGIWGAIIASVLGNLLPRFFKIWFELKLMNSHFVNYFPIKKIGKMLLFSLIGIIPIALVKYFVSPNIWICLVLGFVYVAAVYIVEMYTHLFIVDICTLKSRSSVFLKRIKLKNS